MIGNLARRAASAFSYHILENKGDRRAYRGARGREDRHAKGQTRKRLLGTADELARNFAIVSWMIRRHLDYVSQFRFQATTHVDEIDDQLERLMIEDRGKEAMDVAGRLRREKMFRVAEARRVIHGDCLLVRMNNGRLQGIQGDLIDNPWTRDPDHDWTNGVRIDPSGRHLEYGIRMRTDQVGVSEPKPVSAANVMYYGFSDRFGADQVRSVSPIVTALQPMQDLYEHHGFAQVKAKIQSLIAYAFFRESRTAPGTIITTGDGDDTEYSVDFSDGRPQVFNLDPGDRLEMLTAGVPGSDLESFSRIVLMGALKSLDIPYSFYDEKHTNFFGSRGAWIHYERSCRDKREDQIELRDEWTLWKSRMWVRDGRLILPPGYRIEDVRWEWIPRGMPWWDPAKEVKGDDLAIKIGASSPQRISRERGDSDVFDNIDETAKVIEYAREKGVLLSFDPKAGAKPDAPQPGNPPPDPRGERGDEPEDEDDEEQEPDEDEDDDEDET